MEMGQTAVLKNCKYGDSKLPVVSVKGDLVKVKVPRDFNINEANKCTIGRESADGAFGLSNCAPGDTSCR